MFSGDALVSIIDLVKNYLCNGEWIIGLLIIAPDYRGKCLGKSINNAIEDYARSLHAKKLRIGVAECNIDGYKFWKSISYYEVKKTEHIKIGNKENVVITMNFDL